MSKFQLQIQYPDMVKLYEHELHQNLTAIDVLAQLDGMRWRKQRILQLQLNGKNTEFKVIDEYSQEYLSIILNAFSKSDEFEFRIESNIQLIFPQRELFGLITRKNKEIFALKQSDLQQVKECLDLFLQHDSQALETIYLNSKLRPVQEAS